MARGVVILVFMATLSLAASAPAETSFVKKTVYKPKQLDSFPATTASSIITQLNDYNIKNAKKRAEISDMRKKIDEAHRIVAKTSRDLTGSSTSLTANAGELFNRQNDISEIVQKAIQAQVEATGIATKAGNLKREGGLMRGAVSQLVDEYDMLHTDYLRLKNNTQMNKEARQNTLVEVNRLLNELSEKQERVKYLKETRDRLIEENNAERKRLVAATAAIAVANSTLTVKEAAANGRLRNIVKAKEVVASLRADNIAKEHKLKKAESAVKEANKLIADIAKRLDKKEASLKKQEGAVKKAANQADADSQEAKDLVGDSKDAEAAADGATGPAAAADATSATGASF